MPRAEGNLVVEKAITRSRNRARWTTRNKGLAMAVLVFSAVAVFPQAVTDVIRAVSDGAPTGYLLLMPGWTWAISHRCTIRRESRPDISDSELDWIVGIGIVVFVVSCQQLAAPRLADAAALWHFSLVGLFGWSAGCAVILFGLRNVVSAWPTWVFVLACFPSLVLLIGTAMGGDTTAFSILTVIYGSVALYVSVDMAWHRRLALGIVSLILGSALALALDGTPSLVQQLLPAATVPTALYFGSLPWFRTQDWFAARHHPMLPAISARTVVLVLLVALVGRFLIQDESPGDVQSADIAVPANWSERLELPPPYNWRPSETFSWASRSFGPGATVQRFVIERAATSAAPASTVAAVDVTTVDEPGRLRIYPSGLLYPADRPLDYGTRPVELPSHIDAIVQHNDAESGQTPDDPLWVMLTWNWRLSDNRHQRVTVVVSQQPGRSDVLPKPLEPAIAISVLKPVVWLIQDRRNSSPILLRAALDDVSDIASILIHAVDRAPDS
jgi:hypothetical protein